MDLIKSNWEMLFGGVGGGFFLLILGIIINWAISKRKHKNAIQTEQKLKAGDNSANIQAGRDVIITNAPLGTRTEDKPNIEKELHNIDKSSKATTKHISSTSFEEIFEKIGSATPYLKAHVAHSYKGKTIKWETRLCSVETNESETLFLLYLWLGKSTTKKVYCMVAQEKYADLKSMEENTRIIVQGEIQEVKNLKIALGNAILDFPEV